MKLGVWAGWCVVSMGVACAQAPTAANLEYGPHRLQRLDVYAPEAADEAPVLVMIHGGGWRIGDKANRGVVHPKAEHFNALGVVFVSLNYRMAPDHPHPDFSHDVAAGLAYVHAHAAEWGGDLQRVWVMGHSAGAHLAALVATDARLLGAHGLTPTWLRGVILLDGACYDIPAAAEASQRRVRDRMIRDAFGETREGWSDASPTLHAQAGGDFPPFLIFHAGARPEARTQANGLARALTASGGSAQVVHAPDRDHAGMNREIGAAGDPYTAQIDAFLGASGQ